MTSEVGETVAQLASVTLGGRQVLVAPHHCFACGELNEHGLHMSLHAQDGRCWSELTLDARFQGWDEIVHGGILATILDEVMAWTLVSHDIWSVTAKLAVAFHRPVTIGRRIRAEGRIVDAHRRVSRTGASITDALSGELLASAEGTYVAAPEARRAELEARYRFQLAPAGDEDRPPTGDAIHGDTTGGEAVRVLRARTGRPR